MFKNYLKIATRNLLKHKTYSIINISGLAVGMACCILILLWVKNELSYDKHHANRSRVYRVVADFHSETGTRDFTRTAPLLAPTLKKDFPEIEQAVRFKSYSGALKYQDKQFQEEDIFYADAGVFELFTFPFLKGDPARPLNEPNTIVLTESMAQKYFGFEDPIGKVMFAADTISLKITGVIEDLPVTTHLDFQCLVSFATWANMRPERQLNTWINNIYYTYIMLAEDVPAAELEAKLPAFTDKYINDPASSLRETLSLQPVTDIHLKSNRRDEIKPNGNMTFVYIFSLIAVMVLAIACVNFMNLTSARSINRNKEVGLRKVVGATRQHLLRQFLGESMLMSFVALLLAIFLVEMILPAFNTISGKELQFAIFDNLGYVSGLIVLALIVGLAAGSYPAFLLSGFQPAGIFKGAGRTDSKGIALRKGLVVFQFAISIILIIGSVVVSGQLDFMRNQNLGFEKEQILVIPFSWDSQVQQKYQTLKTELLNKPGVLNVTASGDIPGRIWTTLAFQSEGMADNESGGITALIVDPDFQETYGIEMAAGRDFSKEIAADFTHAVIINEKAVAEIGWSSPAEAVGKRFLLQNMRDSYVIGVVKDFNFKSLHAPIEPLAMAIWPDWFGYVSVRISTRDVPQTLDDIQSAWGEIIPNRPFNSFFLDEDFNLKYRAEEQFREIFMHFSSLGIFIACLGLFGLTSFSAEQRFKEIGIRKVLGASVTQLLILLTKDVTKLLIVANLIAWPVAWYAMNEWLQSFAYRMSIGPVIFLNTALAAFVIACFTMSFQTVKAALANPVDAIRNE